MTSQLLIPLILAWNPQPVDSFRVWRGIEVVATVTTNQARIQLPHGDSALTVTAINNGLESPHSPVFYIHVSEPKLTIEASSNLIDWHFPRPKDTFFRIRKEY